MHQLIDLIDQCRRIGQHLFRSHRGCGQRGAGSLEGRGCRVGQGPQTGHRGDLLRERLWQWLDPTIVDLAARLQQTHHQSQTNPAVAEIGQGFCIAIEQQRCVASEPLRMHERFADQSGL